MIFEYLTISLVLICFDFFSFDLSSWYFAFFDQVVADLDTPFFYILHAEDTGISALLNLSIVDFQVIFNEI